MSGIDDVDAGQEELRSRSQVVQRSLPRPGSVNHNILRMAEPQLNELQKVISYQLSQRGRSV